MGKALEAHGDSGFALIGDRCVVLGKWRFEINRHVAIGHHVGIGRTYCHETSETRFWVVVPTNELAFGNEGWFVLNHTAGSICIKGNVERRSVGVGMTECCGLGFPTLPPSLQAKLDSKSSEHIPPQPDEITAAVAAERGVNGMGVSEREIRDKIASTATTLLHGMLINGSPTRKGLAATAVELAVTLLSEAYRVEITMSKEAE